MRIIALVSLSLTLAASSMPVSIRSNGGVSVANEGVPGSLPAVGSPSSGITSASGLTNGPFGSFTGAGSAIGGAVSPPSSGTASVSGLGSGSFGSSTSPGSAGGEVGFGSGSGTASGSESGSIAPSRRSPILNDVNGEVPQLGGGTGPAIGGTLTTSNPIIQRAPGFGKVIGDVSGGGNGISGALSASKSITQRTPGFGEVVGNVSGGGDGVGAALSPVKGTIPGATGSLSQSG